jgi:elongation factor G
MISEFGVSAKVGKPRVAYKETITTTVQVDGKFVRQTGGHGQYGHVCLEIEPLARGGGFQFVEAIKGGVIPRQYIPPVEAGIKEAMETGVLAGYPVVDIKATIYDGSYHEVDSSELAFKMAGSLALRNGVKKAKPVLLEPIMKLEVVAPEQFLGDIISDLNAKRGHIEHIDSQGDMYVIQCLIPLAETFGYATRLRSLTQGRATHSLEYCKYQELPTNLAEEITDKALGRKYA